jgi:hypothetical protein
VSDEMSEQERLERRRAVDNAIATQQFGEIEIADIEAYARGELSLDGVRTRTLVRERTRSIG